VKIGALIALLLLCPLLALAQPRKIDMPRSEETIGTWLIGCAIDPMTDGQVCRMRHKLWLAVPSGSQPGMALEVQSRFDTLVPVITVRDLSFSTALTGLVGLTATAQIRFDNAPMVELPCALEGASVICLPAKSDAAAVADELVRAKTVLVRFRAFGNLPVPVPDGPLALDLDHTREALARYRVAGPEKAAPSSFTQDVKDTAEGLLRRLGIGGEAQPAPTK
jgi:hypothetical protein